MNFPDLKTPQPRRVGRLPYMLVATAVLLLAVRLPSVILGLLLVTATMRWLRRDFGWQTAVITGGLLAVSWWPIIFSRIGIRPIMLPLFLVGMAYFWQRHPWLGGTGKQRLRNEPACALLPLPSPTTPFAFTSTGRIVDLNLADLVPGSMAKVVDLADGEELVSGW